MTRSRDLKNRKTLSRSLLISLIFHILALSLLQHHSLWFSPRITSDKVQNAPWVASMEMAQRQQILKESFQESVSFHKTIPKPVSEPTTFETAVKWEIKPMDETAARFTIQTPPIPLLDETHERVTLALPPAEKLNLFQHLPKDLIIPHSPLSTRTLSALPSALPSEPITLAAPTVPTQEKSLAATPLQPESLLSNSWDFHPTLGKQPSIFPLPNLPELPTLAELQTVSYSDAFDAELVFLPREEGAGYIFALTLIPRIDLKLPKLNQHYTFLIDRSNSIQSDRLFTTKNAVKRALEELGEEDTFNIIAFDSKMEKMSPVELKPNPASLAKAETFLDSIQLGSFFSSADIGKALLMIVPSTVKAEELYSAILFTDSETLSKKTTQRELLYNWTQYNQGRISLFPIGVSTDANLPTLDVAALFNKGKLQFAPTHRGIKRKVLKTMKSIHSPVAKNMSCSAVTLTPKTLVALYPKEHQLPHLYLNEPYVILGTCETLDDFILFVQGKLKDKWMNIKKKISFLNAKRGGQSLKSEWAIQVAYEHYKAYLIDGDSQHIAEARQLLEPHDMRVAIQ
ncbi:MAG: VWA domain-containing protein [Chlamydiia bacterium]|nr:VWA domain-containing protein [Chlamydiia bacterium]